MSEQPKVVGEGTYGCVHNPPLLCDGSEKQDKEYVSKLMLNKEARSELKEYVIIDKIDNSKNFYLGEPTMCKVGIQKLNRRAIRDCNISDKVFNDYDRFSLLLMKNGGVNLSDYAKTTKVLNNAFLKELHRMFMGLMKFKEHNVIHHDLKAQNIVYNKEKERCNFIDFGLMCNKKTRMNESKDNRNGMTPHHWSFPLELNFLNRSSFDRKLKSQTPYQIDNYVNNVINDIEKNKYKTPLGEALGYLLSSVHSVKLSGATPGAILEGYREMCYQTSDNRKEMDYETFLEKSLDTVDSYGLGISIMKVLKIIISGRSESTSSKEQELGELAFQMYHPSLLKRIRIEEATSLYEKFLEKYVLEKDQHFVDHKIVKKAKISKKVDKVLDKIKLKDVKMNKKQLDQVSLEPVKDCSKGKEYNPTTKRCVKECKKGHIRDSIFKCVSDHKVTKQALLKKNCPKGKVRNPITKRCVLKCKPGYKRDKSFRCVSKKARKRCPNGTRKNKETGNCEKKK